MKTIREWLSELPEPYRSQALEYLVKDGREDDKVYSLKIAVGSAFVWFNTLEGEDYWMQVSDFIFPDGKINLSLIDHKRVMVSMAMGEPAIKHSDVTVKTVNEESVIKSNRQIAEEILIAIDDTLANESEADVIESILNKYFKN